MSIQCLEAQEWIEEEVSRPVEKWVEKTEKKCKKRSRWNPLRWLCTLVTALVTVVVWVTVKVGKWVVRTVCKVVSAALAFLRDFFTGLWDFLAGVLTLDWRRILDGLMKMAAAGVDLILTFARVLLLLDTVDFIIAEIQRGRLRTYVRTKLGHKYSGQQFQDIVDNLRIDHGAFGYRIRMRAVRALLDSETESADEPGTPNLVRLHELRSQTKINVYELCGFEFTEGYWNRKRYKTLKKGLHASGGGLGEMDNPISRAELDTYLASRGAQGPKFVVLSMRDGVLGTKLRAAQAAARGLGLMPQWTEEKAEVTASHHIRQNQDNAAELVNFLAGPIGRKRKITDAHGNVDKFGALEDLCTPVAVGIFRYIDDGRGVAACLEGSTCQAAHDASGVTFIDNQPDIVWKYVPIHELGHYFGLCHASGIDRIMYTPVSDTKIVIVGPGSPAQRDSWWDKAANFLKRSFTWRTLYSLILFKGEPSFTLDEGMQAWDYIIEHFPAHCLAGRRAVIT